jgi:DNA-binding response OmpR family regulator
MNEQRTVVLVEDSDEDAQLFALAIQKAGSDVSLRRASDCAQARRIFAERMPSLIALDCYLRGESGLDLLCELRSQEAFSRVPVIVMSDSASDAVVQTAYARGASSFIRKELVYEDYLRSIKLLLDLWLENKGSSLPLWSRNDYRLVTPGAFKRPMRAGSPARGLAGS